LKSAAGSAKSVDAPDGGSLHDICDDHFAPVPFSCRSATCGTCEIEIIDGAELLEPPGPEERDLLAVLRGPDNRRLACQAVVKASDGVIRLRAIN
jgi:2Fe-2S ferredoxin